MSGAAALTRAGRAAPLLLVLCVGLAAGAVLLLAGQDPFEVTGRSTGAEPAPSRPSLDRVDAPEAAAPGASLEDGAAGTVPRGARRDVAAHAGRVVRLRAVDAGTGAPIAGATITVRGAPAPGAVETGSMGAPGGNSFATDTVGWATVPAREHGVVVARAEGYAGRTLPAALCPDGTAIRLQPSGVLVVVPPAAPEVQVEVVRGAEARSTWPVDDIARPIRVEGSPDLRFDGLDPGTYSVGAHDGRAWLGAVLGVEVAPGATVRVTIEPEPRATFVGEVVEIESGRPIPGVRARVVTEASSPFGGLYREFLPAAETAASGRFEARGVPIGPASVELTLPDGSSVRREVVVREGQEARVVTLRARGSAVLAGRLSAALLELAPAASWRVVARPRADMDEVLREISGARGGGGADDAYTGVDGGGAFVIDAAPTARPLILLATAAGARLAGFAEIDEPLGVRERREGVVVEPLPGRTLTLVVTDPEGAPVPEIEVRVEERIGTRPHFGEFERHRSATGRHDIEVRTPDVSLLLVRADGYSLARVSVPKRSDSVDVELERARDVPVVLVDGSGDPVSGELILAITTARAPGLRGAGGHGRRGATTDALGRATLDLDPRFAWDVGHAPERLAITGAAARVESDWRGSAPIVLGAAAADAGAPTRIRGRIVRPGRRRPIYDLRFLRTGSASVEVDGERFEIVGVPSGAVDIRVASDSYETLRLPVDRLAPGETVDVGELVARPASRVEVVVEGADGRRLQRAAVQLERLRPEEGGRDDVPRRISLSHDSSEPGTYVRSSVGRATWRLRVSHPEKAPVTRAVTLEGRLERVRVTMEDT